MTNPDYHLGQTYPEASLLGLPTELRQRILHELSTYAHPIRPTTKDLEDIRQLYDAKVQEVKRPYEGLEISRFRHNLAIHRRVGEFSCVSALIRRDMEYVKRLWQRDLEDALTLQFNDNKHGMVNAVDLYLDSSNESIWHAEGKQGVVVEGKERGASMRRPGKCWRCMERHYNYDTLCPMARNDPKRWEKLSKRMNGWMPSESDTSLFRGTRIVFGDN